MWGCRGSLLSGIILRGRAKGRRGTKEEDEDKEEKGDAEDAGGDEEAKEKDEGGEALFLNGTVCDCCCFSWWHCTCSPSLRPGNCELCMDGMG